MVEQRNCATRIACRRCALGDLALALAAKTPMAFGARPIRFLVLVAQKLCGLVAIIRSRP
jgi:hypothetical protein